ncbi:MAG: alanine racemase [Gemmatimonadaceae bacterium]|nr:alanine racemase [Gemmatimonadaceae bacterium]MDQ3519186.1 alanine racemase [Gemmatimonadota bacterium]
MTRQLPNDTTRAWVEIDLGALQHNGAALARLSGVPLLPMIKADAYGLGAVPVARALEQLQPWGYGVATTEEGMELRDAGIERSILVFTPLLVDDFGNAREARLTPVLSSRTAILKWMGQRAVLNTAAGPPLRTPQPPLPQYHLGIDTGMSRAGARCSDLPGLRDVLESFPPEGACTHFHSSERNDGSSEEQERRFEQALEQLPAIPPLLHCENGAAIVRRQRSRWSLVRPGIFLYGVGSGDGASVEPRPVASVHARLVDLRFVEAGETVSYDATYHAVGRRRIATLAIGYADGYRRALSNRGSALLNGKRVPVAGLVTMDMTMLDVTDVPCEIGDIATLIGTGRNARKGATEPESDVLTVEAVAREADMSPYELLTGLRTRLPRVYRGGEA